MSGDKRARLKEWLDSGEARLYPLTFPQRELWETSAIPIGDPTNHICCLIAVRGLLTPRNCESALRNVVDRQDALRTSFLPGKERPLQMVRKTCEVNLPFRDLSPAECAPEAIDAIADEIFRQPFDLVQGPLFRATGLKRAADDHVLVFAIHHAIADGWTLGVFVHDLINAYVRGLIGLSGALSRVPLSYTEWDAEERSFWQPAELKQRADFWRPLLAGAKRLWPVPADPGPLQQWTVHLPSALAAAARKLARRNDVTFFNTLLAAFQVAFLQWTGVDDLVVGTPFANRTRKSVRKTMGYCSGIVPLRGQVDRQRPFRDHLRAVDRATVNCFANAMPFAELVQAVGEQAAPGYNPVFQVRFALQNHPIPDVALPTLSAKLRMRSTGTGRFDLACEITEKDEGLEVVWLFRPTMFSQAGLEDLHHLFEMFLTKVCEAPERRIADLISPTR